MNEDVSRSERTVKAIEFTGDNAQEIFDALGRLQNRMTDNGNIEIMTKYGIRVCVVGDFVVYKERRYSCEEMCQPEIYSIVSNGVCKHL